VAVIERAERPPAATRATIVGRVFCRANSGSTWVYHAGMVNRASSVLLTLLALLCPPAWAQEYASRPVAIVVPYTGGTTPDLTARLIAERLQQNLAQPVRVENRPGANGNIGAALVARSAPDGYTLLLADTALVTINQYVYRRLSFTAEHDLVPVAGLVESSQRLLVNAELPVASLPEFIDFARTANPPLAYASIGIGSPFHLAMERLQRMAGIALLHVPYKGGVQAAAAAAAAERVNDFETPGRIYLVSKDRVSCWRRSPVWVG
jgi:tripartite-type tricarboxylate transporter receptor subunit TctC